MRAELKIAADVAWYRIQRFEMANLGAAALIGVAIHLTTGDLLVRLGFGALLNLLVYLNNDYIDRNEDAASPTKDAAKTEFLTTHRAAALRAQLGLLAILLTVAFAYGGGLLEALICGGGVCWLYSAVLKRRPFVDVLAMMAWGIAMPMVAVPTGHADGWALLIQLGLFSGVFESIQVMRDHDEDRESGVRTTAVALGLAKTRWLMRGLLVLAASYAAFRFHWTLAALPLGALLLPIPQTGLERYWNHIRVVLGVTLLIECGLVFFAGNPG